MENKETKTNPQDANLESKEKMANTALPDEHLEQASGGKLNVGKLVKTSFDILTK